MVKKRRRHIIFLIAAMVFSVSFFIYVMFANLKDDTLISMKRALDIVSENEFTWNETANVFKIISMDYHDTEKSNNGEEGVRKCWSIFYESLNQEKQWNVYVIDSKVFSVEEVSTPAYKDFCIDDIVIDSTDAYNMARKAGLFGGTDWAFGYHYSLQYVYINEDIDTPLLVFTVRGVLSNGNEANLMINPYKGNIIKLIEKIGEDENGKSIWMTSNFVPVDTEILEELSDRKAIQEEYEVYKNAAKYLVDPEELTDNLIEGIYGSKFAPYENIIIYDKEEWVNLMTERYGEEWKNW